MRASPAVSSLAEKWTTQIAAQLRADESEPAWLDDLRRKGAAAFSDHGLPHRKVEDWKYTSLKLLEARSHTLTHDETAAPADAQWPQPLLEEEQGATVHLLNGRPHSGVEVAGDLTITPLDKALSEVDDRPWLRAMLESLEIDSPALAFAALNTSMLGRGLVIDVPPGVDAGRVLLQWSFDPTPPAVLHNARVLLRLQAGASLTLVEQFESQASHAHGLNLVMQIRVCDGANLDHVRLQQEKEDAALIVRTECEVSGDGRYNTHGFDLGGGLVRIDTRPRLTGPGARADVNGAFVLGGSQHLDHHVFVDHEAGQTTSNQFFRGVLGGHSRGVFNGKARICPGADGSSVRQSNANLLLSAMAEMDTKPELEIYADEIEASHGATVGQLDEDAVFYLRSRGLGEEQARVMLTGAFCQAVLERNPNPPTSLSGEIGRRMQQALGTLAGAASATTFAS